MKAFNGTLREIIFYDKTDTESVNGRRKLILKEGSQPSFVLEIDCEKSNQKVLIDFADPPLVGAVQAVPFVKADFQPPLPGDPHILSNLLSIALVKAEGLPDGYDIYIVSSLFRAALVELHRDTSKIATVSEMVYQSADDIRPCGCCQLAVG